MDINFCHALETAMSHSGVNIKGTIDYNKEGFQRFQDAKRPKGKDLFVIIHGDFGATFGDWHDEANWVKWFVKGKSYRPTVSEIRERQESNLQMRRLRETKRQQAIYRAKRFWHNTITDDSVYTHPYIVRKQINPYCAKAIVKRRGIKNLLIIPIRDINYELQSVQVIKHDGFKRPYKGTTYKNNMIWLSMPPLPTYKGVIRLCEGYATGCSIMQAIGGVVICALSANNLPSIATLLRQKYPDAMIKMCADNDCWGKENPGLDYACMASISSNAFIYCPKFPDQHNNKKLTDFNDLFVLSGHEEVKRQLILIR